MPLDDRLLREHSARLRALARGLLGDGTAADDVVQDVWLRTLQQPPRDRSRLGHWLANVTRNRARETVRAARRRRAREQRVAVPEATAATAPEGEHLALCRTLLDAVDALEEKYRRVVSLRYFDELPPREVAKRLDLSVHTVRTQLQRALRQLREQLDATTGDRGRWSAALLAFARPDAAVPPAAVTTASAASTAVFFMAKIKGWTAATTAAVVALSAATLLLARGTWGEGDRPDPAPTPTAPAQLTAVAPAAPATQRDTAAAEPASSGRTEHPAVTAAPHGWIVRGRALLRSRGIPAADAPVRLRLFAGALPNGAPWAEDEVTTDSAGTFTWCPTTAPDGLTVVVADCQGERHLADPESLVVPAGATPSRDLTLQVIALEVAIEGTIRGPDDEPVADAWVRLGQRGDARSDAAGRYAGRLPASDDRVVLHVAAAGYAVQTESIAQPRAGTTVRRDVRLRAGFLLEGTVRDPDGAPVTDAQVESFAQFFFPTTTDAAGHYALPYLDPNQGMVMVHATHPSYRDASAEVAIRGERATCDLTLERGQRVSGRVLTPDGTPVEGALVHLQPGALNNREPDAATGPDGNFEIPAAGADWRTLSVRAAGYGVTFQTIEAPPHAAERRDVIVVLQPGRRVHGRVLDPAGTPLAGVAVFARRQSEPPEGRVAAVLDRHANDLGLLTHSRDDGTYEVLDLPPDPVRLTFAETGFMNARILDDAGGRERELDVTLRPVAGFAGSVVDDASGRAIPHFFVRFVAPVLEPNDQRIGAWGAGWTHGIEFRNANGHWHTPDEQFEVGRVTGLEVRAPGYAPTLVPRLAARVAPRPEGLVVRLGPGAEVAGTVRDGADQPVAGVTVFLFSDVDEVRGLDGWTPSAAVARRVTDAAGEFTFAHARHGASRLATRHPDLEAIVDGPFDVPPSGRVVRSLVVER